MLAKMNQIITDFMGQEIHPDDPVIIHNSYSMHIGIYRQRGKSGIIQYFYIREPMYSKQTLKEAVEQCQRDIRDGSSPYTSYINPYDETIARSRIAKLNL